MAKTLFLLVVAGLVPATHVFPAAEKDVDGRDKPGHDENREPTTRITRLR